MLVVVRVDVVVVEGYGAFFELAEGFLVGEEEFVDRFEAVSQRELELGAASMAALVYLLDQYGL